MRLLLIAVLVVASLPARAQRLKAGQVPPLVMNAFKELFPTTRRVRWMQERSEYEAAFRQNGERVTAVFNGLGIWKETGRAIAFSALPAAAKRYLGTTYKALRIQDAAEVRLADRSTCYRAIVKDSSVFFDAAGGFLKTAARPRPRFLDRYLHPYGVR